MGPGHRGAQHRDRRAAPAGRRGRRIKLALALTGAARSTGEAVALGAAAALFSLAGYAFLGVARFSSRYQARSTALAAVGRDRLIVLPG